MATVAQIAKESFDAVSEAITDAVLSATLTDGTTDYSGRVVIGGEKAAGGFPMSTPKDRMFPAYLEGFGIAPAAGWSFDADGETYYITGVVDIVRTGGGFVVANAIAHSELLFQTVIIKRKERTDDGAGGFTMEWVEVDTVAAAVWCERGNERYASDRTEAMQYWKAILPYDAQFQADCAIFIDDRSYGITFVNDVEHRGKWLVLDLTQGVAG